MVAEEGDREEEEEEEEEGDRGGLREIEALRGREQEELY